MKSKLFSLIVSVLAAMCLWVYVMTVVNPDVDLVIGNIPVTFSGAEVLQEDHGLVITGDYQEFVSVHFYGKNADLKTLDQHKDEIKAVVDVSKVRSTKEYTMTYDITLPSAVSASSITRADKNPTNITFTVERQIRKSVEVKGDFSNVRIAEGFMLDSTSTNKTTGEYYDLLDDLKYDANDGDIGAGITRKYVSHAGDEVNDYYQQIRAIQSDENLTKAEKNRLVRALKSQLIERQKEIIAQAEPYREAVNDYLKAHPELSTDNDAAIAEYAELYGITEDQAESRMDAIVYREANREVFGAEYALRTYNADVYDKARTAYAKGVSYETYYDYYFATKEMHADKDENGKSISGSKKAKVVEYINSLDIPPEQKDALYVAAGYTEKSLKSQPWNGGSGSSGGRRGSGKKTTLKAPDAPKAAKITIHGAGAAGGGTASAGTVSAPKASVKVADIAEAADLVKLREAAKKATRTAIKAGNRTIYIEDGSPLDYFLKTGKLPSTK